MEESSFKCKCQDFPNLKIFKCHPISCKRLFMVTNICNQVIVIASYTLILPWMDLVDIVIIFFSAFKMHSPSIESGHKRTSTTKTQYSICTTLSVHFHLFFVFLQNSAFEPSRGRLHFIYLWEVKPIIYLGKGYDVDNNPLADKRHGQIRRQRQRQRDKETQHVLYFWNAGVYGPD